jgi:hypothetical protein
MSDSQLKTIPHHSKGIEYPQFDKEWKIKSCKCGNKIHVFQKQCSECIKESFKHWYQENKH